LGFGFWVMGPGGWAPPPNPQSPIPNPQSPYKETFYSLFKFINIYKIKIK